MVDYLREIARKKAVAGRTGWARWYDIQVAYYPISGRFSYFLRSKGVVNRRDLDAHVERELNR